MRDLHIVDDNGFDVELVREALVEIGADCRVHVAADGEQAMAMFARIGGDLPVPGAIVLDLNLPRIGGRELLDHLRGRPDLAAVPVLVLSGSLNPRDREAVLAAGAAAFLQKPSDIDGFLAIGRAIAAVLQDGAAT